MAFIDSVPLNSELKGRFLHVFVDNFDWRKVLRLANLLYIILFIEVKDGRKLEGLKITLLELSDCLIELNNILSISLISSLVKHLRNFVPKNQLLYSVTKIVLLESTETVIVYLVEPNDGKLEELDEILDDILHLLKLLLPQLTQVL